MISKKENQWKSPPPYALFTTGFRLTHDIVLLDEVVDHGVFFIYLLRKWYFVFSVWFILPWSV